MSPTASSSLPNSTDWPEWWNRLRYQLYAPIYDWVARPLESGRVRALERIAPTSGERILILGSGPGSDLPYLPDGASITAVDAVPAMVRRTRERAETLGMEAEARLGDAQALPFEDNRFDVVLLHLLLSVVPHPEAVVTETARVLAPTGRVSIYDKFVPQGTEPSFVRRAVNPVARFLFSDLTQELDSLFAGSGLEISEPREHVLGGLYTIARARPSASVEHDSIGHDHTDGTRVRTG